MKDGAVAAGQQDSAGLIEMDTLSPGDGEVLMRVLEVGIDGTPMARQKAKEATG